MLLRRRARVIPFTVERQRGRRARPDRERRVVVHARLRHLLRIAATDRELPRQRIEVLLNLVREIVQVLRLVEDPADIRPRERKCDTVLLCDGWSVYCSSRSPAPRKPRTPGPTWTSRAANGPARHAPAGKRSAKPSQRATSGTRG